MAESIVEEDMEIFTKDFEARVRYLGTSLIITIPMRLKRELGLKMGDRVIVHIRKKEDATLALARKENQSSSY